MERNSRKPTLKPSSMKKETSMSSLQHIYSSTKWCGWEKNQTLIEMARMMLDKYKTPRHLWAEAIQTACHAINRLYLHKLLGKTAYELLMDKKPQVGYFWEVQNVTFMISIVDPNSLINPIKDSCLVMVQTLIPVKSSIDPLERLKKQ